MPKKTETLDHLQNHVTYPASKVDLVTACNEMSDVPDEDKEWFMQTLPEGTYNSAAEVKEALNL